VAFFQNPRVDAIDGSDLFGFKDFKTCSTFLKLMRKEFKSPGFDTSKSGTTSSSCPSRDNFSAKKVARLSASGAAVHRPCSACTCMQLYSVPPVASDAIWPTWWKIGRVSALWKRESRSLAKHYRPVTVLDCLSLCMERVLDPQLDHFIQQFIPDSQYGFRTKCGTQDYGVALASELHAALEANLEAILIALDVAGTVHLTRFGGLLCWQI
jgi:hypothetical protein